jgi:hypothetical protein
MKSLIWKEFRENFKWLPVPILLILGPTALMGPHELMQFGRLFYASIVAALFGAVLGFLQVSPESRGDKRSLLLHRPLSCSQIFLSKALAGIGLYLLAVGLPFAWVVYVAATPGHIAQPFSWPMVLPWLADILTGLVYYFAGMLAAQSDGRCQRAIRDHPVGHCQSRERVPAVARSRLPSTTTPESTSGGAAGSTGCTQAVLLGNV